MSGQLLSVAETTDVAPQTVENGLVLLLQAHRYAEELQREEWDFAVEISHLRAAGLTTSDLRWLVCKGLVKHSHEVRSQETNGRVFQQSRSLMFSKRSCFVLTNVGVHMVQQESGQANADSIGRGVDGGLAFGGRRDKHTARASAMDPNNDSFANPSGRQRIAELLRPRWDCDRHEFFVGDDLVKVFRLPSRNQETVLMAFEEDGWPGRVDDPLPPSPDIDPKRRLHDTIRGLNRNQKHRLICFMGDGTGEGIRWKLVSESQK